MGDFLVICKFKSKKFEIIEKFKRAHVTFVPKMFNIPPPNTQERQLIHIVALIF